MSCLMPRAWPEIAERIEQGLASKQDESELLALLKEQDSAALQILINDHGPWIQQLVSRLMAYEPEYEDVVQKIFLKVWQKAASFRGDCSLRTWLFRIAVREVRNHQRSVFRWWRKVERLWHERSNNRSQEERLPSHTDSRWELVQSAMTQLTHNDRELLVLVYVQGCSIAELSESLGEERNTLEVRLHRARNRLKQLVHSKEQSP